MLFGARNYSYSGRDMYRKVERIIRSGREVCIISPYIDAHYAAFIRRHAGRRRYYILSSSLTSPARRILESRTPAWGIAFFVAVVLLADAAVYSAGLLSPYIIALSLLAVAARLMVFRIWGGNRIRLRVPHGFVHAKLYISDKMAASGSANLTYNGMHGNIEHLEVVSDRESIKELKRQFWSLWGT